MSHFPRAITSGTLPLTLSYLAVTQYLMSLPFLMPLGWHTGMAQVGKVQPAPVPTKPIPMVCFTHTHTTNPWVLGNTTGTHKPIPVFHYFSILTWTFSVFLFSFSVFGFVLSIVL